MLRFLARRWRLCTAAVVVLSLGGWVAVANLPSASIWWTLRRLESPDPETRARALERVRPAVRNGRCAPARVAPSIEDPDAGVRAQAAQLLMDTGNVRAFCSAALDRPTTRTSPVAPPSWIDRVCRRLFPPAPVTMVFSGRSGGSQEDDARFARAFEEGDPGELLWALTRTGLGYGFERVSFGCARMSGRLDPPLAKAAAGAPNPDVRLLALVLLVLHHSCHQVPDSIALVEALPEPAEGDPAAPAIRFLKRDGFSCDRVIDALRSADDREQSWALLVACERPRAEYQEAITALLDYDDEAHPLHAPGILAARALGALGDPAAFDVLRRTALEGHYVQRARAIRALGGLTGVDPRPVWIEVMSRPIQSLDDSKEACAGLAERGDAAALPVLEAALQMDLGGKWHEAAVGALHTDIKKAIAAIRTRLPE